MKKYLLALVPIGIILAVAFVLSFLPYCSFFEAVAYVCLGWIYRTEIRHIEMGI